MDKLLKKLFINTNEFITKENLIFEISRIKGFDFSTNIAMVISKIAKSSPEKIAEEIIKKVKIEEITFDKIKFAKPGFINIRLSDSSIAKELSKVCDIPKLNKEKIVVDYSSPNVAKKMHIGHLRSTVIGDSIVKINKHFGHEVISDSHLGDWGTQFGKLIIAYEKWLDVDYYKKEPISELQRIYVKFHEKENEALLSLARNALVKLQNKDEKYLSLWKEFVEVSLSEYERIYKKLEIKFDYQLGESFYNDMMQPLVDDLLKNKIAKINDGAVVVFFKKETKIPPAVIQKSDKGFLYTTSDLATIDYREKIFKNTKSIYVTDNRQNNHFKQVFEIAKMKGVKTKLVHTPFGVMSLEDGNFSTRKGNTINLEDLLSEGFKKARNFVTEKNPELSESEKDEIARVVSIGAIKYFDLAHLRTSDIVFTWDKTLAFNGNSAPYIQYTYTRISSLIRKSEVEPVNDNIVVSNEKEREIVKYLYQYSKILKVSLDKSEPHHIASYLYKLTSLFNSWYSEVKVLGDKQNLNSRLYIAKQVQKIIKEGLGLLGIKTLERM